MKIFPRDNFTLGSYLFLTGIALVYLIAFASLWLQVEGLFGSEGIMPVERYFDRLASQENSWSYILRYPSLLWLDHFLHLGNTALHIICGTGLICSLLALFNFYRGISLFLCWLLYLSLVTLGSPFLSFQWDNILLESGFLAIWLAGFKGRDQQISPFILFLLYLLLFRLMFFSGYVKLASNDPVWWNLTALSIHFETQPLPHALGWYFHQLPTWLLKVNTVIMFFIELAAPFFVFLSRRLRHTAGMLFIFFMLMITISGNYTFFNMLTIVLCLTLFDNSFYQQRLPQCWLTLLQKQNSSIPAKNTELLQKVVCGVMVALALITEGRRWLPIREYPVISQVYSFVWPFRSVNTYGLFSVMTKTRPEIVFELSTDSKEWEELEFKWKPVRLDVPPSWVQPHQPRLDWQLWFAGLYYERVLRVFHRQYGRTPESYDEIHRFIYSNFRRTYHKHVWVHNFIQGILVESRPVLQLISDEDWPTGYTRIRAWLYDYHFTRTEYPWANDQFPMTNDKPAVSKENWWVRDNKRQLFPAFNLKEK